MYDRVQISNDNIKIYSEQLYTSLLILHSRMVISYDAASLSDCGQMSKVTGSVSYYSMYTRETWKSDSEL